MSANSVEFGTLPAIDQGGRPPVWPSIVAELQERPGEWAKVRTCASNHSARARASQIRKGNAAGVKAGDLEVTARGCDLWARYIGHAA